ncbi:YrdB family protein [Paenibacillus maysiensis]|uniref:YrdB family protein n=1 Tax=Paenibacillus maysiensis TaxID=1155954 RepID=UPI0004AF500F|nr:YrdB family protein [Paenibacillus maysiensis]
MELLSGLKMLNWAVRFLLEVCGIVAFAYWGFKTGVNVPIRLVQGVGVPVFVMIFWGLFVSPAASFPLQGWAHLGAELVIFGLATAALSASERPLWAIILACTFVVNHLLMQWWGQ